MAVRVRHVTEELPSLPSSPAVEDAAKSRISLRVALPGGAGAPLPSPEVLPSSRFMASTANASASVGVHWCAEPSGSQTVVLR
ncbi:MAG: hypothetical protein K2J66_09295 [Muribaculaceae bacterium]|nr:hypothetical protein [Muribaculaceae bacterium]